MLTKSYWEDALQPNGEIKIHGGVAYVNDQPIALLVPSTIFGESPDGMKYVCGRRGVAKISAEHEAGFYNALIEADALCFGNVDSVLECAKLLGKDSSSRTTSYLIATGGTCEDILRKTQNINKAKVLLVGCGGIGGLTAINLCGAGLKNIHIVDGDVIEKSNLNRQFFWKTEDVGKFKCDVLTVSLQDRYSDINITATKLQASVELISDLAESFDAVVITADEPLGLFGKIRKPAHCLLVNSGYVHKHLYYSIRGENAAQKSQKIYWERNPWFVGPSFGPSNTELAGIVSALVIKNIADPSVKSETLESAWDSTHFPRNSSVTTAHYVK